MSNEAPQTLATHRRFDPLYHYLLTTLLVVNLVWAVVSAVRHPSAAGIWQAAMGLAFLLMGFKLRAYPLRAQDRIIRLEEQLRMKDLLPPALASRALSLKPGQYVALRFASDEELPGLVQQALDEDLAAEEIKKRIKTWRPDTFRV